MSLSQVSECLEALPPHRVPLAKVFFVQVMWRVPLCAVAAAVLLFPLVAGLPQVLNGRCLGGIDWVWPTMAATALGLLIGTLVGSTGAARSAGRFVEDEARTLFELLPADELRDAASADDVGELRIVFDEVVAAIFTSMLGGYLLTAFVGRRIEASVRHALVDDFLAACGFGYATSAEYVELRRYLLRKGLPFVVRTRRAPQFGKLLFLTTTAVYVIAPVGIGVVVYLVIRAALGPLTCPPF